MRIAGVYSFNGGKEYVEAKYPRLIDEVRGVIEGVSADYHKTKKSKEKTMRGQMLFSPKLLNKSFKKGFFGHDWHEVKVPCDYSTSFYSEGYAPKALNKGAFREMDFVKEKLGVEVQFGKYSFMVYNVCAKMTIFRNLGHIDSGIEIVPVKKFADEMSSGVSYFEQFVWDLQHRGVSNIDIPVLIYGIDA